MSTARVAFNVDSIKLIEIPSDFLTTEKYSSFLNWPSNLFLFLFLHTLRCCWSFNEISHHFLLLLPLCLIFHTFFLRNRNFPQVISNCNTSHFTLFNPSFFEEEQGTAKRESDYKSGVDWAASAAGVENYSPCSIERRKVEGWWRAILIFIVVKLAHKRKLERKLKKNMWWRKNIFHASSETSRFSI